MASLSLKSLIGMLNTASTPALTAAAGLCLSRTNYHVEVGHWLAKLLKSTQNEVAAILKFYGIDTSKIAGDTQKATDRLKTGNGRQPGLLQYVEDLDRHAWLPEATNFVSWQSCSGYLILPLVSERPLVRLTLQTSPGISRIKANVLHSHASRIDSVPGRDVRIRRIIDILTRRRQNTPLITGEADVDKAAVIKGLTLRVAQAEVSPALQTMAARTLDFDFRLLQAGARVHTGQSDAAAPADLNAQLAAVQCETPLLQASVNSQAVAETVDSWTGNPVGRMVSDEIQTVLKLNSRLEERVVGQSHGLKAIAQRIRKARANLTDPGRPIGVFFLVGPSGVGKTETAIALDELHYGGEQNMTTINMSEFKEEHKVSLLMGSPPGYVGYGEREILTEAVRRKPCSVVLLDEMEKAHAGAQNVFYQVFDKGNMKDGEGRDIDFRNTVILMTSNAATDMIRNMRSDPDTTPDAETLAVTIQPELQKWFKPAFLGRITVIPYFLLSDTIMHQIAVLKLGRIRKRIKEHYDTEFTWTDAVLDHIVSRCTEVDSGARNVDKILNGTLLPQMSTEFLSRMAEGGTIGSVTTAVDESLNAFTFTFA